MAKTPLKPSELWSLYPHPKSFNTKPIISKEDRYKKIEAAEQQKRKGLGRHGHTIGFLLSLPIVLTIAASHIIVHLITSIQPSDIGAAMSAVFSSFTISAIVLLTTKAIYKKVDTIFNEHLFNGLPLIVLLATTNAVIAWNALTLTGNDFQGIATGLAATVALSTIVSTVLMIACASRMHANLKAILLLLTVILFLITGFIITLQH